MKRLLIVLSGLAAVVALVGFCGLTWVGRALEPKGPFSGAIDFEALRLPVETVGFDYGQRHRIELDCARQVAEAAGVSNLLLPIDTFAALGGNALTDAAIEPRFPADDELPNTFVPGRNLIFLTFAAAMAWQQGIRHQGTKGAG